MTKTPGNYPSGTVVRGQMTSAAATLGGGSPVDGMARSDGPVGLRLLAPVPTKQPVVRVPAAREADDQPVTVVFVAAADAATRKRVRAQSAELESRLVDINPRVVLPLLDHGLAGDRPYLVLSRPGPTLTELLARTGPRPAAEVAAAARALVDGLRLLAAQDIIGPPPPLYQTPAGVVLGTPLPPVVLELADGHEHEPPEVLRGDDWTQAGQVYACASVLWTLSTGRPPFDESDEGRLARLRGADTPPFRGDLPELVGITLSAALSAKPELRPADIGLLADVFASHGRQDTRPPTHPVPHPVETSAGRRLGSGYLLDREIGRGAMGYVWAGRRRDDGSPVAVKLLRSELAEDPAMVRGFLLERATLLGLHHQNLVRIHDLVAEGGLLALVMDLVDGEDLRKYASRGTLSVPEAARLLGQTAEALTAVHRAGVVHRDIKPENILVTQRNGRLTALLTDFGIARSVDGRATQLVCTPPYVAPELVVGQSPAPPVDIYALGVTAYELVAGHRPFEAATAAEYLDAHRTKTAPRPDGMDDRVWQLISACLDKQPERRPDAAQLAAGWAALAQSGVLHGIALPPTPPSTVDSGHTGDELLLETSAARKPVPHRPAEPKSRRHGRLRWVIAGAAVLLVGAGIGVVLAIPDPPAADKQEQPEGSRFYQVAATVSMTTADVATVEWSGEAASLPGIQSFVIVKSNRTSGYQAQIGDPLPASATSYQVSGLRPDQESCFKVYAYGVTATPPDPQPPAACITPAEDGP